MEWEDEEQGAWCLWRSKDGKPWWVSFRLVEIEGRMECVGMEVRSWPDDEGGAPSQLYASTLRELPFADVLARARRERAGKLDQRAESWKTISQPGSKITVDPLTALALTAMDKHDAALMNPPGQKGGRHAKYTLADLARVAALYSEKWTGGSTSPTKDVATALGLTPNVAAKLVMRCRDPKIGLLGPTEKRKAGGIKRQEGKP